MPNAMDDTILLSLRMLRGLHLKRLNWLVVDLDRGHRNPETVASDIEMCEGQT